MNSAHSVIILINNLSQLNWINEKNVSLIVTGVLDDETATWMSKPRCGVRDRVGAGASARKKRYALQGTVQTHSIIYACPLSEKKKKKKDLWNSETIAVMQCNTLSLLLVCLSCLCD